MRKLLAVLLLAAAPSFAGASPDFPINAVTARELTTSAPVPAVVPAPPAQTADGPRETAVYRNFEIQGSATFIAATKSALDLLGGSTTFTVIAPYISVIEQADRSGMVAWTAKPVFEVGNATWKHSAQWYAGAIAHDGMHSLHYHTAKAALAQEPPAEAWTGTEAERECLRLQVKVLTEIKARQYMMDYVNSLIDDPGYHLIPYEDRDW
ncbi:MAG: hypothetical protein KKH28_14660 [Elusimicrobia bacterium]|nr:hypothetical protein [Elusimicrobiota bacterium]